MQEETRWLKADYYDDFVCKCGQCRNSCCEGWEIAVDMQDYFRLIGLECAPELHHRLECAFRTPASPSSERFRLISPNYLGFCPLHNEAGLCALQVECGAQALPELCRVYPRSLKSASGELRACCSGSCEAVIETLMREAPLRFVEGPLCAAPECVQDMRPEDRALGNACLAQLQNRALPLRDRLGKICGLLAGNGSFPESTDAQAGLSSLICAMKALREDFASLDCFGAQAMERYDAENSSALEVYRADAAAMEARFPHWEVWFENVLANHFFYACMPCADPRLKARDLCAGICAAYGMMRAVCAARAQRLTTRADVADALAGIFRMIEHSAFYYNARVLLPAPEAILAL